MKGWEVCLVFKAPQLDTCHFDLLTKIVHYERVEVTINTSLAGVSAGQFSPKRSGPCSTTPLALNEAYPPPLDQRPKPNYELPPISNRAIAEYIYIFFKPHTLSGARVQERRRQVYYHILLRSTMHINPAAYTGPGREFLPTEDTRVASGQRDLDLLADHTHVGRRCW